MDKDNTSIINVLVAEDNDSNYLLVEHILKGYNVIRAINGIEAVKKVQDKDFDIILMDLKMPGMDGLEATRKIRSFNKEVPIVAVTANVFDSDKIATTEAGCNGFVSKPLRKNDLITEMERVMK